MFKKFKSIIFKIIDQEWCNFKSNQKVRQVQRIKKQRGFAFSQVEGQDQDKIVRLYDTTKKRGAFGELSETN